MPYISKKKEFFKISTPLRQYLSKHGREVKIPIHYSDLRSFRQSYTHYDRNGKDTLWETCIYGPGETEQIHYDLLKIYSSLKTGGDMHLIEHLYIDRIDFCLYGNTAPFRIRVVNRMNDNFDYFYVKNADASRIYGLEIEDLLSPNRVHYLVFENTLIEEHIAGIPGDEYVRDYFQSQNFNPIRLSKEFVKFNERCLILLLGDMHSSNFVVQITPDFEENHYRIRSIDFDQQCYEGRQKVYMPQFYKQNIAYVDLVSSQLSKESIIQYQREERALMASRMRASRGPIYNLLDAMTRDTIAPDKNIIQLRSELAEYYEDSQFEKAKNMGEILKRSLLHLLKYRNLRSGK